MTFSADRLRPHRATGDETVRMWADGEPSKALGKLQLRDRQRIVISYGDKDEPIPDGIER